MSLGQQLYLVSNVGRSSKTINDQARPQKMTPAAKYATNKQAVRLSKRCSHVRVPVMS